MLRKRIILALAAFCVAASTALGGAFPEKPVEAIVPWDAGGGGDLVFRAMAAVFPKYANGQPLLIKNIGGAAGVPGIVEFMKAPADGYTVAHWNGAQTIKTLMSETPYKATDFVGVANIVNDNFYILAKKESGFANLNDVIKFAKENPGQLTFGNAGIGGGNHFAEVMFENHADLDCIPVPFKGGGPLITGLMSDEVDVSANVVPEGASIIQSGQIKILGIFSPERHPLFPDAPTAKEQGIDLILSQYRGIVALPGTPDARVKELTEIFRQIISDPDFMKQMREMGSKVEFLDGPAYGATIAADDKNYQAIIKEKKLGDLYK